MLSACSTSFGVIRYENQGFVFRVQKTRICHARVPQNTERWMTALQVGLRSLCIGEEVVQEGVEAGSWPPAAFGSPVHTVAPSASPSQKTPQVVVSVSGDVSVFDSPLFEDTELQVRLSILSMDSPIDTTLSVLVAPLWHMPSRCKLASTVLIRNKLGIASRYPVLAGKEIVVIVSVPRVAQALPRSSCCRSVEPSFVPAAPCIPSKGSLQALLTLCACGRVQSTCLQTCARAAASQLRCRQHKGLMSSLKHTTGWTVQPTVVLQGHSTGTG